MASACQEEATKTPISAIIKPNKVYKITVSQVGPPPAKMGGFLLHIGDSALQISTAEKTYGSSGENYIPYFDLGEVSIIQKGKMRKAAGYGALTGIVLGGLIGYSTYTKPETTPGSWFTLDFSPGLNAAGGMGIGAVAGTLVGAIIGAVKYKFQISGNYEKYHSMRHSLLGN